MTSFHIPPPPLITFKGKLRQMNSESVNSDGFAMLKLCAPYFYPLGDEFSKDTLSDLSNLPSSVTSVRFQDRQFRRWSGDVMAPGAGPELPRQRYFTVCSPNSDGDDGTLAEELNAYRNVQDGYDVVFGDLMNEDLAASINTDPNQYILLVLKNPESLNSKLYGLSPELKQNLRDSAAGGFPFLMVLGVMLANVEIDHVLDLRQLDAQKWFFDTFVKDQMIQASAERFEDLLPELLNQYLGGSSFDDGCVRLQSIGHIFRVNGIRALIYPSARNNPAVKYKDNKLISWRGWELVLYDEAPPSDAVFVDFGGWETQFPETVRLDFVPECNQGETGWFVSGLKELNHNIYHQRSRAICRHIQQPNSKLMQGCPYNHWEIIEECEEGFFNGGRSWYNLYGNEVVWYSPTQRYLLVDDLEDRTYPIEEDSIPYLIHHPTHRQFHCMFCGSKMLNVKFYARDEAFFNVEHLGENEQYDRTLRHCPECGWWLVEMAYKAYSSDEFAWSLNESIYVQGTLINLKVRTADVALCDLANWLKDRNQSISETNPTDMEHLVHQFFSKHFGEVELHSLGGCKEEGIELLFVNNPKDAVIVQIKRKSLKSDTESIASIQTLNGILLQEGKPHGIIITTSTPQFVNRKELSSEAPRRKLSSGFFRLKLDSVHFDKLLELIGKSQSDPTAYCEHLLVASFEAWKEKIQIKPYSRFKKL